MHGLYVSDELKDRIVALSCAGDVTILDSESLEVKSKCSSSSSGQTVRYAWLLPMTPRNLQTSALMVVLHSGTPNAHLRLLAIDETDSISQVKDEDIELPFEVISGRSALYWDLLTFDTRK